VLTALAAACFPFDAESASAPPANLAPNPGFEQADADMPAFWQKRTPDDAERTLTWSNKQPHSGEKCLEIVNRDETLSRWRTGHLHDLVLKPGTPCRLTAWVKTRNAAKGASLRLYFMDSKNGILAQPGSDSLAGDTDWKQLGLDFTVPAGTAYVMIYLELRGKGAAWFDDVALHGEPGETKPGAGSKPITWLAFYIPGTEEFEPGHYNRFRVLVMKKSVPKARIRMAFTGDSAAYDVALKYLNRSGVPCTVRLLVNGRERGQVAASPTKNEPATVSWPGVDIQRYSEITMEFSNNGKGRFYAERIELTPAGRFKGKLERLSPPQSLLLFTDPGQARRMRGMFSTYIHAKGSALMKQREAELAALKTPDQWRARQQKTRRRLAEFLGDFPPKTPLNPRIVGKLDRDKYVIEKVIFESRPKYYVTANFYLPKERKFPVPGIVFTCGHATEGKAMKLYHETCLGLVLKGYAVLSYDPTGQGERSEYFDPATGKPTVPLTVSQHHQLGRPSFLVGRSLAGYRTWDGIRAVDYILTRPEVDPNKIGVVGNSGGGQMTFLITAADERVKVCAPAHPGGSMENTYLCGQSLIDREMLSLIPPRPCRIIVGEKSNEERGHRAKFDDMMRFYTGLGAPEHGDFVLVEGVHDMKKPKRVAAYEWFNKWFGKEDEGSAEPELHPETPADLNCTESGRTLTSLGGETGQTLNAKYMEKIYPKRTPPRNEKEAKALRAELLETVKRRIGFESAAPPVQEAALLGTFTAEDFKAEKLLFQSEPGIEIPALLLTPAKRRKGSPVLLHLSDFGKPDDPDRPSLAIALVRRGYAVFSVDVRGTGETDPSPPCFRPPLNRYDPAQWNRDSLAICAAYHGRTLLAMRTFDALKALDQIGMRPGFKDDPVVIIGEGLGGLWALAAAAFDDRPAGVVCAGTLLSYKMLITNQYYNVYGYFWVPGALKDFDIPDLASLAAPRPLLWIDGVNHMDEPLDTDRAKRVLSLTAACYSARNAGDAFSCVRTKSRNVQETAERCVQFLDNRIQPPPPTAEK